MGIWVFPIALLLLCLTSESLQGGLPGPPPNLGKGYSPSNGPGTAFGGDVKPQKPGFPAPNGYGPGKSGAAMRGGLGTLGFGGVVMPQKSGYGPGLGARVFAGVAAQPGIRGGMKPPKPGLGAGMKTQKPGFGNGKSLGAQQSFGGVGKPQKPGIRDGNGLGAGAFPETGVQPGIGEGQRPQKPDYGGVKSQKPGFGNGNGLGLGAQSGPPAQNGHGPGIRGGMKPPKPGFGGGRKAQKPGVGGKPQKPDYGTDMKPQKQGFRNGHGLGIQLGYRNGLGARAFQGQGQESGYQPSNGYGAEAELGFHYGNGALEAGIFPETLKSGQAEALQGSPRLALQHWGAGMKPGYGYAGLGNQAEEPEVKAVDVKSQLANGSRGKRSRGDHMLHSGVTTVIPPAVPSPWQE
ncbi:hypothetical protein H671_7g18554 [Cricetulus griseus]|uniref:Uncharacterized protein n=1 Tax=Cricetulus griseus TaxID=10029 RepID=A0A061HWC9_CRIGR|nr:hypothetical protein H671_7g18554 [Cricetulus griseus]